jgi:N-acetylmuramoyl-L-alanine amidase/Putative peptidoglycan binding domain
MTQYEIFQPEVFPGELVAEQPSGAFETEFEEFGEFGEFEDEEEVRRSGGARPGAGGRSRSIGGRLGGGRLGGGRAGGGRSAGRQSAGRQSAGGRLGRGQRKQMPSQGIATPEDRKPRRPWQGRGGLWPVDGTYAYTAQPVFDGAAPGPGGSEHGRWVQDCLNQAMQSGLPLDGVLSAATRSVVRSFQQRENLRVTGIVGPDTEEALKRACAGGAPAAPAADAPAAGEPAADAPPAGGDAPADQESGFEFEDEGLGDIFGRIAGGIGSAYSRVTDALGSASGSRIIDLTAVSDKSNRKGKRDPKKVYALVLHQMACCFKPADPLKRFLTLNAHFAITADGRILQLHPITELLWASNGFNAGSVAVEFAGNFPNTKGTWWQGDKFGRDRPTAAQLEAGRYLVRYLIGTMGLTHILAHRQSSGSRENDPGPEVWYHVGQWAVEKLGLKDGGQGFKLPGANPIPDEWRNWGRSGASREMQEFGAELWQGQPEGPLRSEVSFQTAINDTRANGPGVYTIYKNGRQLYVGKALNLSRRLKNHFWCLDRMDASPQAYSVKLTPMNGANEAQLRRVESAVIKKWGRRKLDPGGILTNVAPELEEEIWGEA